MEKVYKVPKIHCSGCVATVERAAIRVPGVIRAKANEQTKEIRVEFDPARVSEEQIKESLVGVGYPVAS
jgi:Cu2+-exporting ATPase